MAKQDINRGTAAGDGTGENLFDAFGKAINNFDETYQFDADLGDVADGKGAALVGVDDTPLSFTATEIQTALEALDAAVALQVSIASLISTANTDGASLVGVEDVADNFTGEDLETVLVELVADIEAATEVSTQASIASAAYTANGFNRVALPAEATIRIHSTSDCWINFGDSTVTANGSVGIAFARGTEVIRAPAAATHVAVRGMLSLGALNLTGQTNSLAFAVGVTAQVAYSAATANVALPTNTGRVRIYAPTDCYLLFGDSDTVVASTTTATFFEAGAEIMEVPSGATHIAMVQYSIASSAYITGMN
jgi:hypothetical protein